MLNREKLRRFNWVNIIDPKIPETVFKNIKWEDLDIEKPARKDIKDRMHKLFYIKEAKKMGKKDDGNMLLMPLFAPYFLNHVTHCVF